MFKKLLFLLTAAAIYLHYYPQPKLDALFVEYSNKVSEMLGENFGTQATKKASTVYDKLATGFNSFTPDEQALVKEISLNRASIKQFNEQHCRGSQRNHPVFHTDNLRKVCDQVHRFLSAR